MGRQGAIVLTALFLLSTESALGRDREDYMEPLAGMLEKVSTALRWDGVQPARSCSVKPPRRRLESVTAQYASSGIDPAAQMNLDALDLTQYVGQLYDLLKNAKMLRGSPATGPARGVPYSGADRSVVLRLERELGLVGVPAGYEIAEIYDDSLISDGKRKRLGLNDERGAFAVLFRSRTPGKPPVFVVKGTQNAQDGSKDLMGSTWHYVDRLRTAVPSDKEQGTLLAKLTELAGAPAGLVVAGHSMGGGVGGALGYLVQGKLALKGGSPAGGGVHLISFNSLTANQPLNALLEKRLMEEDHFFARHLIAKREEILAKMDIRIFCTLDDPVCHAPLLGKQLGPITTVPYTRGHRLQNIAQAFKVDYADKSKALWKWIRALSKIPKGEGVVKKVKETEDQLFQVENFRKMHPVGVREDGRG